jgi:BASS family bile acid:Na+ symporter
MLKEIALPLALILIMTGMGMTLTPADFKRVIQKPLATFLGLTNQLILLPLMAFGLCIVFGLRGELAVGLLLIASCPGGATSNLISHLSKGDTALSVSLTALSSLITTLTIPLYVGFALSYFQETDSTISLPFLKTFIQLMVVSVIPILLGMFLHAKCPKLTRRLGKPVNIFSIFFLALIVIVAITKEENLGTQFRMAGPAALSLNLLTMGVGFGLAALVGLELRQRITLSIESGIQNGTLALAIALGILENAHIAMPAVVYSLMMFVTGGAMILLVGRRSTGNPVPS